MRVLFLLTWTVVAALGQTTRVSGGQIAVGATAYPGAVEAPTGSKAPGDITFTVAGRRRMVTPFHEEDGRFVLLNEEFNEDQTFGLTVTNFSNTGTIAQSGGSLTLTAGGSTWHGVARARTELVAPYVYAQTRVLAWTAGNSPGVYIAKDSQNYARAYVDGADSNKLKIETRVANTATSETSTTVVEAGDEIMLVLTYPEAWAWIRKPGNGWRAVCWKVFTASGTPANQDLRLDSIRSGWRPAVGGALASGSTAVFDYLRCGLYGGIGLQAFKAVVSTTGRPILYKGKAWFSSDIAAGSDFLTSTLGIISVDLNSGEVRIVSRIFFKPNSTTTTAMCCGQVMLDLSTGLWRVFTNGWGYESGGSPWWQGGVANNRIQQWGASTYSDLLADGTVHVLAATAATTDSTNSMYDGTFRYDGTTWHMVAAETDAATSWSSWKLTYMTTTGDPITGSWTTVRDASALYRDEGSNFAYLNSTWYVIGGGYAPSTGPRLYTHDLRRPSDNAEGLSDYLSTWNVWDGIDPPNTPHYPIVPYTDANGTVKYLGVTFDISTVASGGATQGAIIIRRGS